MKNTILQFLEKIWEVTEQFLEKFWKKIEPFMMEWGFPMIVASFFCMTFGYVLVIFSRDLYAFIRMLF